MKSSNIWYGLLEFVGVSAVIAAIVLMLSACASSGLYQMSDRWCAEHPNASEHRCAARQLAHAMTYCQYGGHPGDPMCPPKSASWDQENLKNHDVGCPTAIFVAPGGNLEQCF